jgi:polyphosphate kinase
MTPRTAETARSVVPATSAPADPSKQAPGAGRVHGDVIGHIDSHAAAQPQVPEFDPSEPRTFNRDLSWLEFNRRVLEQAADERTPLLERVKFLSIFTSNLDEFFMKRVGLIKRQLRAGIETAWSAGYTPRQLLVEIREAVIQQQSEQSRITRELVFPELAKHEINIVSYKDLPLRDQRWVDDYFEVNIFSALTPLAVDSGHRFPFISNLSNNLALLVRTPPAPPRPGEPGADEVEPSFARLKIPQTLRRMVAIPSRNGKRPDRFVPLPEIIRHNLAKLFHGVDVVEQVLFRVTRSAGIQRDELEATSLIESVEQDLKLRKFARAIRLEIEQDASTDLTRTLMDKLNLDSQDVYERSGPIEYLALAEIADLDRPELKESKWRAATPPRFRLPPPVKPASFFATIRKQDVLVHHPYESFADSVERFIAMAAIDPDVVTIKQTLYRTSPDSPFIESMIRAAENGKQVACLVELRARFDEDRNVSFARKLEKAGVHVAYGVGGYKTHCKTALVVRKERQGLRCYAHIGTGNYHPKTANLYTDVGLFTCDPLITADLVNVFNYLTGISSAQSFPHLLVAPFNMRRRFVEMIDREIAFARRKLPSRIIAKLNSLEDTEIVDKLYQASQAGVKIVLIVRGFCCLRPGVPALPSSASSAYSAATLLFFRSVPSVQSVACLSFEIESLPAFIRVVRVLRGQSLPPCCLFSRSVPSVQSVACLRKRKRHVDRLDRARHRRRVRQSPPLRRRRCRSRRRRRPARVSRLVFHADLRTVSPAPPPRGPDQREPRPARLCRVARHGQADHARPERGYPAVRDKPPLLRRRRPPRRRRVPRDGDQPAVGSPVHALNYTLRRPRGVAGLHLPLEPPALPADVEDRPGTRHRQHLSSPSPARSRPSPPTCSAELIAKAGIPPGVINIVHGDGTLGGSLVEHPAIPTVSRSPARPPSAVGSPPPRAALKRVSLELGGKNPFIIFPDADIDGPAQVPSRPHSAPRSPTRARCASAARACSSTPPSSTACVTPVVGRRSPAIGDPSDPATQFGALVSSPSSTRSNPWFEQRACPRRHHPLPAGSRRLTCHPAAAATASSTNPPSSPASTRLPRRTGRDLRPRRHASSPSTPTITPSRSPTARTTASPRLSSPATSPAPTAWPSRLHAGIVWINCWMVRDLRTPFGGMKASGVGREGGAEALRFFTEPRNVCIRQDLNPACPTQRHRRR